MEVHIKKKVTEEEVEKLIAEGWNFRVKKVKGRNYISARKGKNENGLGAYSEENWALINRLLRKGHGKEGSVEKEPTKINKSNRPDVDALFASAREWLHIRRTTHAMIRCLFKGSDGFCTYWRWLEEPPFAEIDSMDLTDPIRRKVVSKGDSGVWVLKAYGFVCADCPAFIDEKIVELIWRLIIKKHGMRLIEKK
jgi:hypothetical protein